MHLHTLTAAPQVTINFNNIIWTQGNFSPFTPRENRHSFLNYLLKVPLS